MYAGGGREAEAGQGQGEAVEGIAGIDGGVRVGYRQASIDGTFFLFFLYFFSFSFSIFLPPFFFFFFPSHGVPGHSASYGETLILLVAFVSAQNVPFGAVPHALDEALDSRGGTKPSRRRGLGAGVGLGSTKTRTSFAWPCSYRVYRH